jgi:nesprin-1
VSGPQIQLLEGLLEGWLEHENGVQALKAWLTLQEDKLKKKHRIEDVASVQSALKDCQVTPVPVATATLFCSPGTQN